MKKKFIIILNLILIILNIIIILYYINLKIKKRYIIKELFIDKKYKLFSDFIKSERLGYNKNRININKDYINNSILVDKLLVKDKIKELNISDLYIAKVLGIYKNTSEINIDKLPNNFVIKVNHWSGDTLVVNKKELKNIDKFKKTISKRFDDKLNKIYTDSYEYLYRFIKPQLFIEEFLNINNLEYKLHVIHGKVIWIYIKNFETNKTNIYTIDWKELNIDANYNKERFKFDKPKFLNKIINIAELITNKLNIDYVRIDFYTVENKIYFGEFTMTPYALNFKIIPIEFDKLLMEFYKTKKIDYNKINKYIKNI
jgi:hypothetical protein